MEEAGEFQDWEMLQNSDTGVVHSSGHSRDFGGIEGDSEAVIRSDYFALNSEKRYARTVAEADDPCAKEGSVDSNNSSRLDPCSEPRYGDDDRNEAGFEGITLERKNSREFLSDSGSDGSVSRKFSDFEEKRELDIGDDAKGEVGFGGIGEIEDKNTDSGEFWSDSGGETSVPVKFGGVGGGGHSGFGNFGEMGDVSEFSSEAGVGDVSESGGIVEVGGGGDGLDSAGFVEGEGGEIPQGMGNLSGEAAKSGEGAKTGLVWWKLPLELLKFCVFRVSPVWSISIAAAVMGFIILGRRLYKMRRKSLSIPLKVTVDDKKVSQFMTRAARLNEAFSVVRRVPIIRPSLPAAGVTPWPVMSLR